MSSYVYNAQLDAFELYHLKQEEYSNHPTIGPALPALGHATSGAAGTAISKLLTYPLDLVITRLQVQRHFQTDDKDAHYDGILDAVEKIYKKEGGIKAFYSGIGQETLKGVVDSFLFFLTYTYLRQRRINSQGSKSLPALEEIGVGVIAGAFSKFWTTPIQNIVTRKQTAALIAARDPASRITPSVSAKDIALQIRDEKGLQGFWSGYSASLVLTLNPAITFLLHKVLLRLAVPRSRQDNPGARLTFLLAAVSKAMASTVTYPFSLAKARAQVSSQKPSQPTGPVSETEKPAATMKLKAVQARQRTVFSTILRIAKTEGLWALYQGLGAEVMKGFFSHGITMLMKDRIHIVIVNLYSLVLKSLEKYPNPEELGKMASDQVKDVYEQGKEKVENVYEQGKEQLGDTYVRGVEVAESASAKVQGAWEGGTEKAGDLLGRGKDVVGSAAEQVQNSVVGVDVKDIEAGDKGNPSIAGVEKQGQDTLAQPDLMDIDAGGKNPKD